MVDLNTMDDTGLPWAFLHDAINPSRLVPGAYVVVGSGEVRAVAQVIDVDNELCTCDRSEAQAATSWSARSRAFRAERLGGESAPEEKRPSWGGGA